MTILILCTGNSCRSQMAEGFLRSFNNRLKVYSAGTRPAPQPNPHAVKVMGEVGIDIADNLPKNVDQFTAKSFDYVITVCDSAKAVCPRFTGQVRHRLHVGFKDPADFIGTPEEVLKVYREVRDRIREKFFALYTRKLLKIMKE